MKTASLTLLSLVILTQAAHAQVIPPVSGKTVNQAITALEEAAGTAADPKAIKPRLHDDDSGNEIGLEAEKTYPAAGQPISAGDIIKLYVKSPGGGSGWLWFFLIAGWALAILFFVLWLIKKP